MNSPRESEEDTLGQVIKEIEAERSNQRIGLYKAILQEEYEKMQVSLTYEPTMEEFQKLKRWMEAINAMRSDDGVIVDRENMSPDKVYLYREVNIYDDGLTIKDIFEGSDDLPDEYIPGEGLILGPDMEMAWIRNEEMEVLYKRYEAGKPVIITCGRQPGPDD